MELDFTGMRHNKKHLKHGGGAPLGRLSTPLKRTTRSSALAAAASTAGLVEAGLAQSVQSVQGVQGAQGSCSREDLHQHRKCVCPPAGDEDPQAAFPQVWNELRLNQQLCDGAIRCADGKTLPVHRAILSAVSPYFKALFTNSLNGGQPEPTEVSLLEVGADLLRPILDFAYTGECGVTARNVERLLPLADRLGVVGVVQQCCHFLLHGMLPDNCLGIFRFAQQYFCHDLEASGRRYVLHHFSKILHESAELYDLSAAELCRLLSDDGLNARSEELVFEAARRWIDRDVAGRRQHLAALLPCVRLGFTSLQFLNDTVLAYGPIRDDEALQQALMPAKAFLTEAVVGDRDLDLSNPVARPRVPFEILFAVGGWSAGSPTNFVETYDCRADRWCRSPHTDAQPRAYHGLVQVDGLVYMLGGYDGVEHYNTVRSFNAVTGQWRELACMHKARCYVSVCTLGGEIYAMGGFDGHLRMSSAEAYEPQSNQWRIIPSMNKARSDASAAALNSKIYIAGGFNGQAVLNSVEVFDPVTSQWSLIPCMQNARSGVSLVAYQGFIYALGGFNGSDRLSCGERYDPGASEWQPIPNMYHARSNFAAVIIEDLIYVVGGFNGSIIPNTEYLDVHVNEWCEARGMNLNRSALAAVVLAGLPNAEEYSFLHTLQQEEPFEEAHSEKI